MIGYEILEYACLSDVGMRRSHNQDAFAYVIADDEAGWRERGHFFLVADGMGGHAVGELASKKAVDLVPHTFQKYVSQGVPTALRRAFLEANASIHQLGQQNPEFENTGTTSSALLLSREGAWVSHVGDSRVYRIRSGYVEQITFDHSWQWELARRQGVDPSEIDVQTNVIVRSLGPQANVEVDVEGPHPIAPGDGYLLCSDGLSNMVPDQEIGAIFHALPLAEAAQLLVDVANLRGGPDNVTAVLVRLPGDSPPSSAELQVLPRGSRLNRVLYQRLPWSGIALGAGITLALVALVLVFRGLNSLAIGAFMLAGAAMLLGLIGLRKVLRPPDGADVTTDYTPPRVYRRASCRVDKAMVEQFAHVEKMLREQAQGANWPMNWDSHKQHYAAALGYQRDGNFDLAFRDYCRALLVLTDALRSQRSRGETFKPLW